MGCIIYLALIEIEEWWECAVVQTSEPADVEIRGEMAGSVYWCAGFFIPRGNPEASRARPRGPGWPGAAPLAAD